MVMQTEDYKLFEKTLFPALFSASSAWWQAAYGGGETECVGEQASRRATANHSLIQACVSRTNDGSVLYHCDPDTHTVGGLA